MELSNEFEVAVPVEQAWAVLTDIERIATCLPGAQLQEIDGEGGPLLSQFGFPAGRRRGVRQGDAKDGRRPQGPRLARRHFQPLFRQEVDYINDQRRFSGSAHFEVADTNDRNVECL